MYGFDKELQEKRDAKYDPKQEQEAREWMEQVLGEKINGDFYDALKDGQLLLKLLNKIIPSANIKINKSTMPFNQMENIALFLSTSASNLDVAKHESFQTVDLYERKNTSAVLLAIFSLARHAASYRQKNGLPALPQLGPKLADKHQVSFSEEKLNAGVHMPSQQSGYHAAQKAQERGATQSGMNFGLGRQVVGQGSKDNLK